MPSKDPSREAHFPAIEKRYGEKMAYWFKVMAKLDGKKYPEQIAHLKENFGFSQAHANALVMYSRGSTSSRRFETPNDYYKSLSPEQRKTIKAIFKAITSKYPKLELVIAWNQPILRLDKKYIFGVSTTKNYLLLAPFSSDVIDAFRPKLSAYTVNKKTFAVPNDWQVDAKLLQGIVKMQLTD
jgi:uncharacterized protein YdhG (YjbR/CyaY superfamily)